MKLVINEPDLLNSDGTVSVCRVNIFGNDKVLLLSRGHLAPLISVQREK